MSRFAKDPCYQAFRILQLVFVVAPILAGADKFFYLMVNWSEYLSPYAMQLFDGHVSVYMMVIGAVEIIAGIGVAFKPRLFSSIITLWLLAIIGNLLMTENYYDIILRDIGLMFSALSLSLLSKKYA